MPVCFQLTRIGEREPQVLQNVDRAICQNLGLEFSDDRWAYGWYNNIGLMLALGKSFQEIGAYYQDEIATEEDKNYQEWNRVMLRINHFLLEHYTTDSWRETGR